MKNNTRSLYRGKISFDLSDKSRIVVSEEDLAEQAHKLESLRQEIEALYKMTEGTRVYSRSIREDALNDSMTQLFGLKKN